MRRYIIRPPRSRGVDDFQTCQTIILIVRDENSVHELLLRDINAPGTKTVRKTCLKTCRERESTVCFFPLNSKRRFSDRKLLQTYLEVSRSYIIILRTSFQCKLPIKSIFYCSRIFAVIVYTCNLYLSVIFMLFVMLKYYLHNLCTYIRQINFQKVFFIISLLNHHSILGKHFSNCINLTN